MSVPFPKNFTGETSFRKKGGEGRRIPGTKVSYHNVQLLTSTGVPSLDSHLSGGIGIGTVLLVEEDLYNTYSKVLVKYFVAEGVTNAHSVLLASGDVAPETLLKEIPTVVEPKRIHNFVPDDELKIAWRYKVQRTTEEMPPTYDHNFDLSKPMTQETIQNANIATFTPSHHSSQVENDCHFLNEPYLTLYQKIKTIIEAEHLQSTEKHCNKILRIVISSVHSPLWMSESQTNSQDYAFLRFLYLLRSLLRSSYAVALVTVPATVHQNAKLRDKIRQMSDYVIHLQSLMGPEKSENVLFKDFDGLIQLVKLPVLNTFMYQIPASDLAFKLRRKAFQIEQLQLPPEIEDPSPYDVMPMCGAPSKLLDF